MTPPRKTALVEAVIAGNATRVETLLEGGASPDEKDKDGNTALVYAAVNGQAEIAGILLGHRADPDLGDPYGITPLMYAARDSVDVLRLLIDHGADLYKKDNFGDTAYQWVHVLTVHSANADTRRQSLQLLKDAPARQRRLSEEKLAAEMATDIETQRHTAVAARQQGLIQRAPKMKLRLS